MYKCAFLGCGPRAVGHARGYATVKRGRIAAICDMNEERLNSFGDQFEVGVRYTDAHEMLEREKPDILNLVTLPGIREETMKIAVEHEVPVCIIEKPVALFGEDWKALRALVASGKTKFCVNTQLHFHPRNLELKQNVAQGRIGQVRFVDVSARSTPLDQGVHVLELAHSYNGFSPFTGVFGQVSDGSELDSGQPAPAMASASINFANGVHGMVVCGACAPYATDDKEVRYYHKRIAVYGTEGFVHWTMNGWERFTKSAGYESGTHSYGVEDDLAQGLLTEAAIDWLIDDSAVHPTNIDRSLAQFNAILGIYQSALTAKPVDLPFEPPAGLEKALRERLTA